VCVGTDELHAHTHNAEKSEERNRSQASLPMMKAMLLGHLVMSGGSRVCASELMRPSSPLLPCCRWNQPKTNINNNNKLIMNYYIFILI
jgi:hypothetical protein